MLAVCFQNQWPVQAFENAIASAARFEAAKLVALGTLPSNIDLFALQTKVAREWLESAVPAGNA